jgi:hypothetical protein
MPEDGENVDKWITVTGNSKTKNLLNPKPKPKLHNAIAILSQPNAPTHYNAPSPTQQMDNDKTIMPLGPREHRRQQKLPSASTSNEHYSTYAKVTICSLTTVSPKLRMNAQPLPRTTPRMKNMWQLVPPMHNATNLLSGLPNADKIRPTAWVQHSIEPSKSLPSKNMSVLPNRMKSTYLMPRQPLVSCQHAILEPINTTSANMTNKQASLS